MKHTAAVVSTHSSSCSLPPLHFPIIRQFLQRGSGMGDGRGCCEEWGCCSWVDRGGLEGGGVVRSFSFLSPACFFYLLVFQFFFFFFSSPRGDRRHPRYCSVRLGRGARQGRRALGERAAYRRDVNSSVDVERIRCSSKRESDRRLGSRSLALSLSFSLFLTLSLPLSLTLSVSLSLSLPASLLLSAVS